MANFSDTSAPGTDSREVDALQAILAALQELPGEARERVLRTVATFFGIVWFTTTQRSAASAQAPSYEGASPTSFSSDRSPSPKEFLLSKRPQTDVDRVACLAYYLTHHRGTSHFKTLDLSKLNTEAAQLKFSNAAQATDNATKAGLLVPASKGAKQLSAVGELYVEALPDRAAAKAAMSGSMPRRRNRKSRGSTAGSAEGQA